MTMTLKLDTGGLRALIADNPEFKLVITQAVTNNIKDDIVKSGIDNKLRTILNELVETNGWGTNVTHNWKSKEFKQLVYNMVQQLAGRTIEAAAQDAAGVYLATNGQKFIAHGIQKLMNEQLDNLITEDVVRAALDKKLKAALAKITE